MSRAIKLPVRAFMLASAGIVVASAHADFSFSVDGNLGALAARATFTFDDGADTLTLLLENLATQAAQNQAETLTGVFWSLAGDPSLDGDTAELGPGSKVTLLNVEVFGDNLNDMWAWRDDITNFTPNLSLRYGVGASGLDIFGPSDTFSGTGPSPDGSAFNIIPSAGVTGGGGTDTRRYVNNSMLFTFNTTASLNQSDFGGYAFQYGTSLDETTILVPEPATMGVLAAGAAMLLRRRRKVA